MKKNQKPSVRRARILNAIAWALVAIVVVSMVVVQWYNNGCETKSLVIASIWYTAMVTTFALLVDHNIKECNN